MTDYISREAVLEILRGRSAPWDGYQKAKELPAADVRPVVTCADCKYNTREVNDLFGNKAIQCITGLTHRHDWFCADGVKEEES